MSKYCQKCGKELPDDAFFCSNCGFSFSNNSEHQPANVFMEALKPVPGRGKAIASLIISIIASVSTFMSFVWFLFELKIGQLLMGNDIPKLSQAFNPFFTIIALIASAVLSYIAIFLSSSAIEQKFTNYSTTALKMARINFVIIIILVVITAVIKFFF